MERYSYEAITCEFGVLEYWVFDGAKTHTEAIAVCDERDDAEKIVAALNATEKK